MNISSLARGFQKTNEYLSLSFDCHQNSSLVRGSQGGRGNQSFLKLNTTIGLTYQRYALVCASDSVRLYFLIHKYSKKR